MNLKQIIEKSKDWTPDERFGQFIYNVLTFGGEDQNHEEITDRLYYIDNDKLIEAMEAWLSYKKKAKQNGKTQDINI